MRDVMIDGVKWQLVSDKIWDAMFVQCPKCNDGIYLTVGKQMSTDEDGAQMMAYRPALCSCGHILLHEDIQDRIDNRYMVPSLIWVCPDCSVYQHYWLTMTDIKLKGDDYTGEYEKIEQFEGEGTLKCKSCAKEYAMIAVMTNTGGILRGLCRIL